jgi:hypothetical protein
MSDSAWSVVSPEEALTLLLAKCKTNGLSTRGFDRASEQSGFESVISKQQREEHN